MRGPDGIRLFREQSLDAGAGIREVVSGFVAANPGFRVVSEPFMQIRQALGISRTRALGTIQFLTAFIEDLKVSGFIPTRCDAQARTAPWQPRRGRRPEPSQAPAAS